MKAQHARFVLFGDRNPQSERADAEHQFASVSKGLTALLSELEGVSVVGCAQDLEKVLNLTRVPAKDSIHLDFFVFCGAAN